MKFLGNRSINITLIYIQLAEAIFKQNPEEFTCKAAKASKEAETLVEDGFEYVCTTPQDVMIFRKRKQLWNGVGVSKDGAGGI